MPAETGVGSEHRLQCMEIWGGNRPLDSAVSMTGIDAWAYSRVYRDGDRGGDVVYVSSCASGRISRMLLADVSGHGAKVDRIARGLRDLMRANINRIQQDRLMTEINRSFASDDNPGLFATAVVATYFLPTRSLAISNAGHPPPLYFHAATARWSVLATPDDSAHADLPFGVLPQADYATVTRAMADGDLLFCYTDAFVESRNADGSALGQEGLLALARELPVAPHATWLERLVAAIETRATGNLRDDDASALLLTPNSRQSTFFDNVIAPFRLLGSVLAPSEH